MRTLFKGEFSVDYGQMYIDGRTEADIHEGPEDDLDACFMGQRAALCGAAVPGHLILLTGISSGAVPLTVELHEEEPSLDYNGWEDIVETPFRAASNDTTLIDFWIGEQRDLGLPAGTYRARYHCRGMDQAVGTRWEDEPVLDEYLLQFWPAPYEHDRIVKQTSESAAYWHQVVSELSPLPTPDERSEAERITREKEEQEE